MREPPAVDSYYRRLHRSAALADRHGRYAVTVSLDDLCSALNEIEVMSTAAATHQLDAVEQRDEIARLERKLFYMRARLDRELGKITGHQLFAILEDE